MGIRQRLRKRILERYAGEELPRLASLLVSLLGREERPTRRSLGQYDAKSYPGELAGIVRRREEVAEALRAMDLTSAEARREAIPELQALLQKYPHPLAYETLLMAYVDAGRWDEARGVAFAARERRVQCSYSPHPEVRAEIDRLREWTDADVDALRAEREAALAPAPSPAPAPSARPATA